MRIFHSLCSHGGARLFPFYFPLFSTQPGRERVSLCVFCPLVFPLWSEGLFSDWVTPMGYAASTMLYAHRVRISNLLAFLFHHNNLALFLSLSLTHFFISLSLSTALAGCFYFALFSRAKNKRSADSTISAHSSSLLSHTGACFDWPLHSLEPMEAAAILYRAKKKKKRLQMK